MRFQSNFGRSAYSTRYALTWQLTFQDSASEQFYERSVYCSLFPHLLPITLAFAAWSAAPLLFTSLCVLLVLGWWRSWPGSDLLAVSVVYSALHYLTEI